MRAFEFGLAVLFSIGGARSLWYWARRPFASPDLTDQLLYAIFRTARIGSWFGFAGLFVIYATADRMSFAAQTEQLSWYLAMLVVLSGVQFATGLLLGHRRPRGSEGE
ncbi:MAG: hypothetical protein WEA10_10850 [Actinomycetota bacterium]